MTHTKRNCIELPEHHKQLEIDRLKNINAELLEALKELLSLCNLEDDHGRLVIKDNEKINAARAIAKAEGK